MQLPRLLLAFGVVVGAAGESSRDFDENLEVILLTEKKNGDESFLVIEVDIHLAIL